jgi:hypothetical protein
MLATSSLKELLKAYTKPTEENILNNFILLLNTYKIRYTLINKVPFFVVANLAQSKGLNTKDFAKNFIQNGKCILAGKFKKLEGKELAAFKSAWAKDNDIGFSKARNLWVCDWRGSYSYLSNGYSNQAKSFQNLGADSVQAIVSKVVPLHPPTPNLTPVASLSNYSEDDIQEALCSLASYTNRHFKREHTLFNSLADGVENTAKTRRFDLSDRSSLQTTLKRPLQIKAI